MENGLILKGCRVIIPAKLRNSYMEKLHTGHMGITKTQLRARDTIFWPKINQDIKNTVGCCHVCQKYQASQPKEPLIPHEVPPTPWTKLGSDIFYLNNRQYLIITDYTTKYAVIRQLPEPAPSGVVIRVHKNVFGELGIPRELVSDRGPHFNSHEFRKFCAEWGIQHSCSSPTYAQSNGAVERAIRTVKNIMKKAIESNEDPDLALLAWRSTPLDRNTKSPAELLLGRKVAVNLPVKASPVPDETRENWTQKRQQLIEDYNRHSRPLAPLQQNTHITYQDASVWKPGVITQVNDQPRSYTIQTPANTTVVRNRKHIRPTTTSDNTDTDLVRERSTTDGQGQQEEHRQQTTKTPKKVRFQIPTNNNTYVTRAGRRVKAPKWFC